MNQLEQLKTMTTVVVDSGDIDAIAQHQPIDATTNPSLILKATQMPQYADLLGEAVSYAKQQHLTNDQLVSAALLKLLVIVGSKILQLIPGRVSTEVDARLSFDSAATITQAQQIIQLYQSHGVARERVLIKIAATWEGIRAAEVLEKQGIHCNLTLMFDIVQAAACAEAKVTLISPFVGRILDWYRLAQQRDFIADEDPGVLSVRQIFNYLHHFNYPTTVMGASFRHIGQIQALAGCDSLTISPALLDELQRNTSALTRCLDAKATSTVTKIAVDQPAFRWQLNQNAMATEKLADGIRLFAADTVLLEQKIKQLL